MDTEETKQDACSNYLNEIDLDPTVDEYTAANVSLHCIADKKMTVKFNPGMYIIEQSVSESTWRPVKVITGSVATFTNLTAGTDYRFRFYEITEDGILRPEMTDWFSTYEADYIPLQVKNISVLALEVDENNGRSLLAEVAFEPAKDRNCNYEVLLWDGELYYMHYRLDKETDFQFKTVCLAFDKNYSVSVISVNGDNRKDTVDTKFVPIPSCLEYYNNLTICAPAGVEGLQAEHRHLYDQFYDLNVVWDEPHLEPDNYTIEVTEANDTLLVTDNVPGNQTEIFFPNVKLGSHYIVNIIAESLGGVSVLTTIEKDIVNEYARVNKSYRELIIGVTMSITIAILVGMIYLQYYKQKNKHFSVECARFESFGQKDQPIETTTKLLHKDYESEFNNIPLVHDKFELSPKLLKLNNILGSGAYGIVRLGSLEDKFGNTTNVAVKMLKENPSMEDVQNFHKEILIMKFAGQHPNIVSLIGCCLLYKKPVLVVEYCCKGDLQTYLRKIWQSMVCVAFNYRARLKCGEDSLTDNGTEYRTNNSDGKQQNDQNIRGIANRLYDIQQDVEQLTETVTASDLLNFARQITTGMECLSSNRIIHRDLAARNILVCADGIVKISDFGLSRDVYQENLYRKQGNGKLPLKWIAIEALTHQVYTTQSDVWSFGILLWEIVTMGAHPYPGIPTNVVLKLLKTGYRMERPSSCSEELYDVMFCCWNTRPQNRPTFTQLKESLDKLLFHQSENKYLNMDEILYDDQDQYRILKK
ncbi:PREDICTED: tyrosine-protein kinase receptor torso-like [Dufourea novaeangliae]|uniref:tyrosine-protein kinase receptor torso-like n=1 Tax=Dufourea novaeangliae TaxID=178035 RepID=UPI000766F1C6|nr:PREDICTED: tyrosine-protein kinase receptor torso-like [Dufourea novaeangliae]